jgi:hypothetical protein
MFETTEETKKQPDRAEICDAKGRFMPGHTGNANGRPKKINTFSDTARALLASKKIDIEYTFPHNGVLKTAKVHFESSKTINHALIAALIKEGMDGNVQAIKELIDRTEGRAKESIDHTTLGEKIKGYTVLAHPDMWDESEKKENENQSNNSPIDNGNIS